MLRKLSFATAVVAGLAFPSVAFADHHGGYWGGHGHH